MPMRGPSISTRRAIASRPSRDVVFAQHHWPVWGNSRLLDYLAKQRDTYKYLHDQTLRLINHGYRSAEIAERLALPKGLEREWHVRGYYGTFSHNAKAIYQRYLGWYDANPANLNPLPPAERAKKTVGYMGGADAVIAKAREDFAKGEYRWVADAMSQVVFAEPDNRAARELAADAMEQMGYQAEIRYLAQRLPVRRPGAAGRHPGAGRAGSRRPRHRAQPDARSVLRFPRRAPQRRQGRGQDHHDQLGFPDLGQRYVLTLQNCALTYLADRHAEAADATVTLDRGALNGIILREVALPDAMRNGAVRVEGNSEKVVELFGLLDEFTMGFDIIEPRRQR